MLIEYEQLLYYKGFMGQSQYIFGSGVVSGTVRQWDSGDQGLGIRDWGLGIRDWGLGDALRKW